MDPGNTTPPCPYTVTVRRNPHRRARPTPATSALNTMTSALKPRVTSALKPISLFSNTQNPNSINPNSQNPNFIQNGKSQNPNIIQNEKLQNQIFENPNFDNEKAQNLNFENPNFQNEKPQNSDFENYNIENPSSKKAVSKKPVLEKIEKPISEKFKKALEKTISDNFEKALEKPISENFEKPILEKYEKPLENPILEKIEKPILEKSICEKPVSETLKVYLRIKPMITKKPVKSELVKKTAWPKKTAKNETKSKKTVKTKEEICVFINDENSVTLCPPKGLYELKRAKAEIFEGFESVFSANSSQVEVFDKMVKPLVDDFLRGRSGMLAALGPSGSGKTHTVFGTPREPGVVPLALGRIFADDGMTGNQLSRTFSLSMFEISEKGKTEKLCDLLQDGGDLCFQQSAIRGLHEVLISDVQQAECLIARGMLRRATAMTNSNSQSSRSQCVINIRTVENKIDQEADVESSCAVLTIVDLAGAEREKKTGNQGARLLESNFINNTSMVFGLCLRSLLEHQKNPTKPLQKHFQSSLLTRYLREYLEGKKRMALILTVKSGEEDYLDSSLLLRQAAPYTKIKFDNAEELKLVSTKRHKQTMPRVAKRRKCSIEESSNTCGEGVEDQLHGQESQNPKEIAAPHLADQDRIHLITQNFAKAMWKALKSYKTGYEVAQNEIKKLTDLLSEEKARRSKVELELKQLKGSLSPEKEFSLVTEENFGADKSEEQVEYQLIGDIYHADLCNVSSSPVDNSVNQEKSYQVDEVQVQNLRECHADENTRDSKLEIELKDINGEMGSLSVSGIADSENQRALMSSPEPLNITKESSPEQLTVTKESSSQPLALTKESSQEPVTIMKESSPEKFIMIKESSSERHAMNKEISPESLTMTQESSPESLVIVEGSSPEPLAIIEESSPERITITTESSFKPLTNWKNKNKMHEETKERPFRSRKPELPYKAEDPADGYVKNRLKTEKISSPCKPSNVEKPKRRLAPASSILLKDLGGINFEDENMKPKGTRGDKKTVPERNITQGSLSLLRLLNSNLRL